jgi:hypothetical protein
MDERTNHGITAPTTDPPAIRAEMAKTRLALEQKLGELKRRFTDPLPASKKRNRIVAKKKSAAKKSASSSRSSKKKSSRSTGASMKRTAGKVARTAADVLGDVLKGAATGAARGAAEVVEQKARSTKKKSRR